jgi:pSer/pThr/pTyr-binding forkhead associated (FHA) protein
MGFEDELIAAYRESLQTAKGDLLSEQTWLDIACSMMREADGEHPGPALLIAERDGTRRVELTGDEATLGRDESCTVCLPHRFVSRRHCRLACRDGDWTVEDTDSANGTLVNGILYQRRFLVAGDILQIGEATILFLPAESAPAGDASQ